MKKTTQQIICTVGILIGAAALGVAQNINNSFLGIIGISFIYWSALRLGKIFGTEHPLKFE